MDLTKFTVGSLLGGITAFVMGFLIYGLIIGEHQVEWMGAFKAVLRPMENMFWPGLIVGNLMWGAAVTYILMKANISSLAAGAMTAATAGFFISSSFDATMYGTTYMYSWKGMLIDIAISTVVSALIGAVVGWWLSRK